MRITAKDKKRKAAYDASKPQQLGNLHERMKYVMLMLTGDERNDLWQAIYDLEIEVAYHEPADPPYGRRTMKLRP